MVADRTGQSHATQRGRVGTDAGVGPGLAGKRIETGRNAMKAGSKRKAGNQPEDEVLNRFHSDPSNVLLPSREKEALYIFFLTTT